MKFALNGDKRNDINSGKTWVFPMPCTKDSERNFDLQYVSEHRSGNNIRQSKPSMGEKVRSWQLFVVILVNTHLSIPVNHGNRPCACHLTPANNGTKAYKRCNPNYRMEFFSDRNFNWMYCKHCHKGMFLFDTKTAEIHYNWVQRLLACFSVEVHLPTNFSTLLGG